jgi:tetratricopeptide (TPR) repeat protein
MKVAQDYFQKGVQLQAEGQLDQARSNFQIALEIDPAHINAINYLGVMNASSGRQHEAISMFYRVVCLCDTFAPFYFNLANSLYSIERYGEAINAYTRCLEMDNSCVLAYYRRGLSRHFLGDNEGAISGIIESIILEPRSDDFLLHAGIVSQALGSLDRAEAFYKKAGRLNPGNSSARNNYGAIKKNSGSPHEAYFNYIPALCSSPGSHDAWYNLAGYYDELPDANLSIKYIQRALNISSDPVNTLYNCSLYFLKNGNFSEGWRYYGSRWQANGFVSQSVTSIRPFWLPSHDKPRVLIWGEQGIGDQILMGSLLPEIEKRVSRLILAVTEKLVPVFRRSFPSVWVVSYETIPNYTEYDYHISMGALGQFFRPTVESFFARSTPFLLSDKDKAKALRAKLTEGKLVCGISWHSSRAAVGSDKSIDLEQLLPILSLDGVSFVNLQYGDVGAEISRLCESYGIDLHPFEEIDKFSDVDGLTSLVDMCDIVVTVSNTTAHIAGALGKETALMVPLAKGKIWYWGNKNGTQSLWYPEIKFFEQLASGDWGATISMVEQYIQTKRDAFVLSRS